MMSLHRSSLTTAVIVAMLAAAGARGGEEERRGGSQPEVGFATASQIVLESAGTATLTVELSEVSPVDVIVPFAVAGTASGALDSSIDPSPLTISAGQLSADITLTVVDDDRHEMGEVVEVGLYAPVGATLGETVIHTVAIHDARLGGPIDGLNPMNTAAFRRGKLLFERRFRPSEGLGPFYNATSCASCHSKPVTGGAADLYRNFFLAVYYDGTIYNQSSSIAPFLSQVVPAFGSGGSHQATTEFTLEGGRPVIPDKVFGQYPVLSAQRNSIPVFGVGLFEFITDQTIRLRHDPGDVDQDGISGRVNTQLNGTAVGRFGTKAQVNNIELFTRGPLQNQMGITTKPIDGDSGIVSMMAAFQVGSSPNDPTLDSDPVPDPELTKKELRDLIAFTKFLAPPFKKPFDDAAKRGEAIFEQVGCASCHVPSLPSSRGPVHAYSDLLMHDMGPELQDSILLGDISSAVTDFRTQPLWGVSLVSPYMHDGRAATLLEAIDMHGGEAQDVRDAFFGPGLTDADRDDVITFLEHL